MHPFLAEELERSTSFLSRGVRPAPRFRIWTREREHMVHLHPALDKPGQMHLLVCGVAYFMAWHSATSFVFTAVYEGPRSLVGDAMFACLADRAEAEGVVCPICSFDPFQLETPKHYTFPDCPIAFDGSLLLQRPPPPPEGLHPSDWPDLLTTLFQRGLLTLAPETAWLTGAGRVLN